MRHAQELVDQSKAILAALYDDARRHKLPLSEYRDDLNWPGKIPDGFADRFRIAVLDLAVPSGRDIGSDVPAQTAAARPRGARPNQAGR